MDECVQEVAEWLDTQNGGWMRKRMGGRQLLNSGFARMISEEHGLQAKLSG